jgi:hypothetical protein
MSTFVCSVRKRHPEVIYDVTANISFRQAAWMGRRPVRQDASGNVHVT